MSADLGTHLRAEQDWYAATVAVDFFSFIYLALFYQVRCSQRNGNVLDAEAVSQSLAAGRGCQPALTRAWPTSLTLAPFLLVRGRLHSVHS